MFFLSFFFNDTATTEIYTLSLHDALPISRPGQEGVGTGTVDGLAHSRQRVAGEDDDGDRRRAIVRLEAPAHLQAVEYGQDRKSTRLNSSHSQTSYAVFCLKKNKYSDSSPN